MNDLFSLLLKDLEIFFKCALSPDINQSCIIRMPSGIEIHLSLDRMAEFFCMGTRVGELPSYGKYRESILKTALMVNAQLPHDSGTFGYSEKTGQLILFAGIPMKGISSDKIIHFLEPYIKRALEWKESLGRSEIPLINQNKEPLETNPFGSFMR
jgi:hypothetical protein